MSKYFYGTDEGWGLIYSHSSYGHCKTHDSVWTLKVGNQNSRKYYPPKNFNRWLFSLYYRKEPFHLFGNVSLLEAITDAGITLEVWISSGQINTEQ